MMGGTVSKESRQRQQERAAQRRAERARKRRRQRLRTIGIVVLAVLLLGAALTAAIIADRGEGIGGLPADAASTATPWLSGEPSPGAGIGPGRS
jgi:hypothetical protein